MEPEMLWSDRKSHYTNVALQRANSGAHPNWDPDTGFGANRAQIVDVYNYYRDLAQQLPDQFLWAGLGRMAGGAVVGGLDADPGFAEGSVMVRIGRDIFFDLAWMHECYLDAPDTIATLAGLHDQFNTYASYSNDGTVTYIAGAPRTSYRTAWEKIIGGDPAAGNLDLLANEQWSLVEPQYAFFRTFKFAGLPRCFTEAIHPYHRAFLIEEPTGDVLVAADRWDWITRPQGMWEQWVACGSAERSRLVALDLSQTARGDFGEPGRPDLLPLGGP
jgi:hypothetical protein